MVMNVCNVRCEDNRLLLWITKIMKITRGGVYHPISKKLNKRKIIYLNLFLKGFRQIIFEFGCLMLQNDHYHNITRLKQG